MSTDDPSILGAVPGGAASGGLDVDWDTTPVAPPTVPRLVLDADVGMGALFVVHHPSDVNDDTAGGAGNDACAGVGGTRGTP